jgi:formylmethanofuran dehydrogenase subunit E
MVRSPSLVLVSICYPNLDAVKSGKRSCATCAKNSRKNHNSVSRRLPIEEVNEYLDTKSIKLISEYISGKTFSNFRCLICGGEFKSQFRLVKQYKGRGCLQCKAISRKSSKLRFENTKTTLTLDAHLIAEQCGFTTDSTISSLSDEVEIVCKHCQSKFTKPAKTLRRNRFHCPCQPGKAQKARASRYIEEATAYAVSRGGTFVGGDILRKKDKAVWRCREKHQWTQPVDVVLRNKSWCKECAGQTPRDLDELQKVAASRGGKVLSTSYVNVDHTYEFECNLGHTFKNSFSKVVGQKQWCPRCSKGSKSEEICRTTFEQLFGGEFKKFKPKWLKNSRGYQMELDGYNQELKIGFEYQGIQHFKQIGIYKSDIELRKIDDARKLELCRQHDVTLFYVTYQDSYEDYPSVILKQAIEYELDISQIDFTKKIDFSLAFIRDNRIEELISILNEKQITLHSKTWLGSNQKYDLECRICGSVWQARGNSFFNSRRVSGCKKCAVQMAADFNRGELRDLIDYASKYGGECLSDKYVKRLWSYEWRCAQGHEFVGNFNNMVYRNKFCPVCDNRKVRTNVSMDQARQLFDANDLELLESYTRQQTLLAVRCRNCGLHSKQSYANLAGNKPACQHCQRKRLEAKAYAEMLEAGVRPIEPFTSSSEKWLCECLTCFRQVTPRLSNIRRGQGACVYCGYEKARQTRDSKG